MEKQLTTKLNWKNIIKECCIKFNNKYIYIESEQAVYKNVNDTKIIAHCSKHGQFEVSVASHKFKGVGCRMCTREKLSKMYRSDWTTVISSCIKKHNGIYTYPLDRQVVYKNAYTIMTIYCHNHDEYFQMSVHSHKDKGSGCNKCAIERTIIALSSDWDTVISQCIEKHNGNYTYDINKQPVYENVNTIMIIHCNIHGEDFKMSVDNHKIRGQGCKKCAYERNGENLRSNWEDVINECRIIHNDTYIYNINKQAKYINQRTKMIVFCQTHGYFNICVDNHKNLKQGCNQCNSSKGEQETKKYLDNYDIKYIRQYLYDDCRGNTSPLKFDFYLPDHNILIEYDGIQHYEYSPEFFHKKGYWQFEKQQEYDQIKNDYCIRNDIPLIRIRYDIIDIVEYLENKLNDVINS